MKITLKLLCITVGSALALAFNIASADNSHIQEIGSVDLGELAHTEALQNKQLMIVYYQDDCKVCEELNSKSESRLSQTFAVYKSNINEGFSITCPTGEALNEQDFMAIKGISKLPALVISDRVGNVTFVENNITTPQKLVAAGERFMQRTVAKSTH